MLRFLYIPETFKNILLAITGASFWMYLVCLITEHFIFGSMFVLIGLQLTSIDTNEVKKKFSEMNILEKQKVLSTYAVILLTITAVIAIVFYTRRKIDELRLRLEQGQETPVESQELEDIPCNKRNHENLQLLAT